MAARRRRGVVGQRVVVVMVQPCNATRPHLFLMILARACVSPGPTEICHCPSRVSIQSCDVFLYVSHLIYSNVSRHLSRVQTMSRFRGYNVNNILMRNFAPRLYRDPTRTDAGMVFLVYRCPVTPRSPYPTNPCAGSLCEPSRR